MSHTKRISEIFKTRIEHIYTRISEVFLFIAYYEKVEDPILKQFLRKHVYMSWKIISYAIHTWKKSDFWQDFKKYCIAYNVKIPKIVELFISEKITIHLLHIEGYKIKSQDLNELIRFAEQITTSLFCHPWPADTDIDGYYYEIVGRESKTGVSRKNGNGSMITLPVSWRGKKVISVLIE